MTTAQRITKRMQAADRLRGKDSIYSVVLDGDTVICHTEATLDIWWSELAPEDKAALYELHLEGALNERQSLFTVHATLLSSSAQQLAANTP